MALKCKIFFETIETSSQGEKIDFKDIFSLREFLKLKNFFKREVILMLSTSAIKTKSALNVAELLDYYLPNYNGKIREIIKKSLETTPETLRNQYIKTLAGKTSPRISIKIKCLECVGWEREEVARCTSYNCPLYKLKPY